VGPFCGSHITIRRCNKTKNKKKKTPPKKKQTKPQERINKKGKKNTTKINFNTRLTGARNGKSKRRPPALRTRKECS